MTGFGIRLGLGSRSAADLGPMQFGPLLYSYGPEGSTRSGAEVLSLTPLHGTAGPTLALGGGTPEIGSWGYGGQEDVRATTAADGRSGQWTRPTAVADYAIACVFTPLEAVAGRLFQLRAGAIGAYNTNMAGAMTADAIGRLYWYAAPTGTGTVTGAGGAMTLGTRHCAVLNRIGSTISVYLDGVLLASGSVGAAAIPSQVESIHYLDDPTFSQSGRHAVRALHVWSSAVDVAAVHAWTQSVYGVA